jgi:hypothetical protein
VSPQEQAHWRGASSAWPKPCAKDFSGGAFFDASYKALFSRRKFCVSFFSIAWRHAKNL